MYGCKTWSLISRKDNYLRGFENKVLRNALGPERGDVVENGGKYIIRKFLSLSSRQIIFGRSNRAEARGADGVVERFIQGFGVDT